MLLFAFRLGELSLQRTHLLLVLVLDLFERLAHLDHLSAQRVAIAHQGVEFILGDRVGDGEGLGAIDEGLFVVVGIVLRGVGGCFGGLIFVGLILTEKKEESVVLSGDVKPSHTVELLGSSGEFAGGLFLLFFLDLEPATMTRGESAHGQCRRRIRN